MCDRPRWDATAPSPDHCQEGGKGAEMSLTLQSTSPLRPSVTPCPRSLSPSPGGGRAVTAAIRHHRAPFGGRSSSDAAGKVIFFLDTLAETTVEIIFKRKEGRKARQGSERERRGERSASPLGSAASRRVKWRQIMP